MSSPLKDAWAARPAFDQVLPLSVGLSAWTLVPVQSLDVTARVAFYAGVATVSGLVLAAATFVAALTYQSANILMSDVRSRYAVELARNWHAVIRSCLLAAIIAITCIAIDYWTPRAAFGAAAYLLLLVGLRGYRALWWFMYTLYMEKASDLMPPPLAAPVPKSQSRR